MTETEQLVSKLVDSLIKEGITNFNGVFDYLCYEFGRRAEVYHAMGDVEGSELMGDWSEWFSEFGETCGIGGTSRPDLVNKVVKCDRENYQR